MALEVSWRVPLSRAAGGGAPGRVGCSAPPRGGGPSPPAPPPSPPPPRPPKKRGAGPGPPAPPRAPRGAASGLGRRQRLARFCVAHERLVLAPQVREAVPPPLVDCVPLGLAFERDGPGGHGRRRIREAEDLERALPRQRDPHLAGGRDEEYAVRRRWHRGATLAAQRGELDRADAGVRPVADIEVARAHRRRARPLDAGARLRGGPSVDGAQLSAPGVEHVDLSSISRGDEE